MPKPSSKSEEIDANASTDAPAADAPTTPVQPAEQPTVVASPGEPIETGPSGRVIKFMGHADVKIVGKGETVQKTLPALTDTLTFNAANGWQVNTADYPNVPESWWTYLTTNDNFLDVTTSVDAAQPVPLNEHQTTFLAMKGTPVDNAVLDSAYAKAAADS